MITLTSRMRGKGVLGTDGERGARYSWCKAGSEDGDEEEEEDGRETERVGSGVIYQAARNR